MKRWSYFGLSAFAAVFIWSCKDALDTSDYDVKKITANTSLVLPLASGDLFIKDLLANAATEYIKVDNDGLVYLEYKETLPSQEISSLFKFDNSTFTNPLPILPGRKEPRVTEQRYPTINNTVEFPFAPEKLSEIKFKNTSIKISVTLPLGSPASGIFEIELKLPNTKLNDVAFQQKVAIGSPTATFSLKDYVAQLNENKFPVEVTLIERPHASPVDIPNSTTASVKIEFVNIDYQYIKGFFGAQSVEIPAQTIDVNAFNTSLDGATVSFADPKVSLSVSNDYGIPTNVNFLSLEARKKDALPLILQTNPSNPISITPAPSLGQSATTSIVISNTNALINFAPNQFFYKISAKINDGLTKGLNFCAETSKLRVTFNATIPLYGQASNIILTDEFDIDLSEAKDTDIETGAIRTKITNELPLNATLQMSLVNAKGDVIEEALFTPEQTNIVKASTVDAAGNFVSAGVSDLEPVIPKEKLKKLFEAKKVMVRVEMNTAKDASGNSINVKFKSTYKLSVAFSLKAKLKLKVDL